MGDGTLRYDRVAMTLHWLVAAGILFNLAVGIFHESLLRGWNVMPAHEAIGITVLALSLARLAWRLTHRPPPLPSDMPGWERAAAHGLHALLYALMLSLPLTGWAMVSGARRFPLQWFGLFTIPYLPVTKAIGGGAHELHGVLGWVMLALVIGHIAAALRHHFLLHNAVLHRMMPAR